MDTYLQYVCFHPCLYAHSRALQAGAVRCGPRARWKLRGGGGGVESTFLFALVFNWTSCLNSSSLHTKSSEGRLPVLHSLSIPEGRCSVEFRAGIPLLVPGEVRSSLQPTHR